MKIRIALLTLFLLWITYHSKATHIRAGEIVVHRISNATLTYKFSIIGYTDTESTVVFGSGDIDFGDGTVERLLDIYDQPSTNFLIEEEVEYNVFEVRHTFPGPGRYTVRYTEQNRNAGVVNMSNSVDTPFYIETDVVIDPFVGFNDSPQFLVPPIDRGAVGAIFLHNPGAFDRDGDSLSYRLTKPKQFFNSPVNDYVDPNDPQFYENYLEGNQERNGPPVFKIDSVSGLVTIDAPGAMGEYNIAFVVDEWRKIAGSWFNIGSMTRDMQIIIEDTDNLPPVIEEQEEICVEAGQRINRLIVATDPDGHDVELEAFGGPFSFEISPATFSPDPSVFQEQPASMTIDWTTDCSHIRQRPYEIQLRARDNPEIGPRLVDFKTLMVTVVGPAPTGLTADLLAGRQVELNWDAYRCGEADSIEIWRRVDSYAFEAAECVVGMPANAGYTLIDVINNNGAANQQVITNYLDNNNGFGLAPGALYCYRIVARYPDPAGGFSYASTEACISVDVIAPVMLNVDVTKTDREQQGEIYIRWEEPYDLDEADHPRPFNYEIVRHVNGFNLSAGDTIHSTQSKEFTDTGLYTFGDVYTYQILAYNANYPSNDSYIDASLPASSVKLEAQPSVTDIRLYWSAETPWSIASAEYPWHLIYRAVDDGFGTPNFQLLDSVNVLEEGLQYTDDGSIGDQPLNEDLFYHYYVETRGSYGNNAFEEPFINRSQEIVAQTNDIEAPCTPVNFRLDDDFSCASYIANRPCSQDQYVTVLDWEEDVDDDCDFDIVSYNIYYSDNDNTTELPLLTNVSGTTFSHTKSSSLKGYYQIASVDRSGNVSERSPIVTIESCPYIEMPNAFSPNGDGKNDTFTPFTDRIPIESANGTADEILVSNFDESKCMRFVDRIEFRVFDRTGGTLFTYDSNDGTFGDKIYDIKINWDGTTNTGRILPSGTYYYAMKVTFDALDPSVRFQDYNGWVQIVK